METWWELWKSRKSLFSADALKSLAAKIVAALHSVDK